jgi:MSHA biogenesis protein MshO
MAHWPSRFQTPLKRSNARRAAISARQAREARGFTLIELVMVIVLMGVLGTMVAVFMRGPIDAYFASARRAALTDVADTVTRRMARDIRKALPNSLRNPTNQCVEFIPTKTGGRYRTDDILPGDGKGLNFNAADTTFNMLGLNAQLLTDQQIAVGDVVAINNLGIPGADAYATTSVNTATVSAVNTIGSVTATESTLTIASTQFLLASADNRFFVIPGGEKIVAYVCSNGNLLRSANHAYASSCPTSGATVSILATKVAACNFVYNGSDLRRNGLVQLSVSFTDNAETVSLYHEVHVNNSP